MTAPERGTAALAPELARHVARILVAAGRSSWSHPPGHPAVRTAFDRQFRYAVGDALDPDAVAANPPAHL